MPFGVFGIQFDLPEFFLGILLGIIITVLILRARPIVKFAREWISTGGKTVKLALTAPNDERYRQDLLFRLDNLHLTNNIFSLRQILIPPRLLVMRPATDPLEEDAHFDRYYSVLPTLPDWNTLAASFQPPSIQLSYLLKSNSNVLITGALGSGKSIALAYIAIAALTSSQFQEEEEKRLPIFVHAADLDMSTDTINEPLNALTAAACMTASPQVARFLPGYLKTRLDHGRAIILLDGLDELPIRELEPIAKWLTALLGFYPQHQVIAAGPPRGYDGIQKAGLFPVPIAPWNKHDVEKFMDRWANAWQTYVQSTLPKDSIADVDPVLLNAWLRASRVSYDPLEITLKIWASYVGDIQGPSLEECLDAFVERVLSPNERHAAQAIATYWIRKRQSTLPASALEKRTPLQKLVKANVLHRRSGGQVGFFNPSVGAYLAASGFSLEKTIQYDPLDSWEPSRSTARHYASQVDLTEYILKSAKRDNKPLFTALFTFVSWLRSAPEEIAWRDTVLGPFAKLVQDKSQAYGFRLRIIHSIVNAGEKAAKPLFLRMLQSNSHKCRILGALGLGGLQLEDSVDDIIAKIQIEEVLDVRFTCFLSLAAIGSTKAISSLGRYLIDGDENDQLFAAEALASNPGEGIPLLKEALEMDKVGVRRAAVYGLARVPGDEVDSLLLNVQMEDDQAIVRNAASDVIEQREAPDWKLSPPAEDIASLPWLLKFAAEAGVGVTPGKGANEILRRALFNGSEDQKIASLEAMAWSGGQEFAMEISQAYEFDNSDIHDAAFEALWRLEAAGSEPTSVTEESA
ncbi:MAG: hypothetical protein GTO18_11675 [Anaerolineales bacterium]|nr:hypothetical protein [Anaerolineales bacterium]